MAALRPCTMLRDHFGRSSPILCADYSLWVRYRHRAMLSGRQAIDLARDKGYGTVVAILESGHGGVSK
jgi:hypothetical protein